MVCGRIFALVTASGLAAMAGCQRAPAQVAAAEAPVLPVSKPIERQVIDYVDFTGRTDAVDAVDIRPRVTGYLVRAPFKEGSEVKKGDLLFEVDPRPYKAQYDQAVSVIALNDAQLQLARSNHERNLRLKTTGGISEQEFEQGKAALAVAVAQVEASKAALEVYKLNLEFTKVKAPVDGQVSRYYLTEGNLVNQDQSLLTTVVSLDPIYVYFELDEPTLLRLRRARNAGLIKPNPQGLYPLTVGLQGEDGFPHEGKVDFVNNQVNPATGSIAIRGIFDNPKPEGGTRLLSPGMFVRVRLPIGQPHMALLVIDRAIGSDQGLKFVYVIDAEHKAQQRRVTTGALQQDGLRVIVAGLKADDVILIGGLQQVRPQMTIQPEPRTMPTLAEPAAQESQSQASGARGQESRVRSQESGASSQGSAVRNQESGSSPRKPPNH